MKTYQYQNHELKYFFRPAQDESYDYIGNIHEKFLELNSKSGKNLNYGIFDKTKPESFLSDFYKNSLCCLIYSQGELIGGFYNIIIPFKETHLIHQGLVLIYKNSGVNLLHAPYVLSNVMIREKLGDCYISSISSTPSIVTEIADIFSNVWPGYNSQNLIRPPSSEYKDLVKALHEKYIIDFFPNSNNIQIDYKRFIVTADSENIGFEGDFYKMSRASNLLGNLFCHYWINYDKGEDLIQIGKLDKEVEERNKDLLKEILK